MIEVSLPHVTFEDVGDSIRLVWRETLYADFDKKELIRVIKRKYRVKPELIIKDGRLFIDTDYPGIEKYIAIYIQNNLGALLRNRYTKRKVLYIHEGLDVPLLGYNAFGLIDRGTNLIQVRGVSGCNLSCVFCSVDEGPYSRTRKLDYVVDIDYLMKWFDEVARIKGKGLEAHLDGQGEPLIYPFRVELVQALREHPNVSVISMQSNGTLLNDKLVEELAEAGLDRVNLSIHSLDPDKAKMLMGRKDYDLQHVLDMAEALVNAGIDVLIAPVIIFGVNDNEAEAFIEFARKIGAGKRWPALGFQNYVPYKFGRNPVIAKVKPFKEFYAWLRALEEKTGMKPLVLKPEHFGMEKREFIPLAFRPGEVVKAEVVLPGRIEGEMIAKARNRLIEVINTRAEVGDRIRVRIVRTRHGIYIGTPV
ncbi:probable molybdenum cofactor biosynthesis protein A [Thermococcus kodakarensis KOD1]|uniref:Probable molybdenum cofactor biosynthesis protein A n=1 Tax=Thermococcus kodakarensis (strain ATCC BAA-918 / JCM 12380 / KOD1) TaxID=69014 RepID=Q5JGI4_THEKO|nr:radical SAM protein [Thermococcus kodakarensis]WCN27236.1 radical SAM protein [Thermococcus kodakarensis]WCN29522.1 radical SAM protein [Thermococcus kodakarensis]BAD85417.1 probable molybdenum cofactor biosynthesis protein A [Thermococcus kodakarensis KOD1]